MKNVIYYLSFILLTIPTLYSQTDGEDSIPPNPLHDFVPIVIADTCNHHVLNKISVMRFASYSKVNLEYEYSLLNPVGIYSIVQIDGAFNQSVEGWFGNITVTNVPNNSSFIIYTINSCGLQVQAGEFSTNSGEQDMLSLSSKLYDELAYWSIKKKSEMDLYDYLMTLQNISESEKIEFIQNYFMNGDALPPTFEDGIPNGYVPVIPFGPQGCFCKLTVKQNQILSNFKSGSNAAPQDSTGGKNYRGSGYYNWESSVTGPAKYVRTYMYETCDHGFEETKDFGIYQARLSYNLLCEDDGFGDPADCICEKELNVRCEYFNCVGAAARAWAHGFCWGSRGARAYTSDLAILTKTDLGAGTITPLAAEETYATAECRANVNPNWFKELLDVVGDIVKIAVSTKGFNTLNIGSGQVDTLIKNIKDLIDTPLVKRFGTCIESLNCQPFQPINYSSILKLKVNTPIEIVLSTKSKITTSGYNNWRSQGKISSNFYLAAFIKQGYGVPRETNCCTRYWGNFACGAAKESQHDDSYMKHLTASFLNTFYPGQWEHFNQSGQITTPYHKNFDLLRGQSYPSCTEGGGSGLSIRSTAQPILVENNILVKGLENASYELLDVTGRILQSGAILNNTIHVNNSIQGQLYILRTRSKYRETADKIILKP